MDDYTAIPVIRCRLCRRIYKVNARIKEVRDEEKEVGKEKANRAKLPILDAGGRARKIKRNLDR